MTFEQDKRESDFLKGQKDAKARNGTGEGEKKDMGNSSVNREENDEKI